MIRLFDLFATPYSYATRRHCWFHLLQHCYFHHYCSSTNSSTWRIVWTVESRGIPDSGERGDIGFSVFFPHRRGAKRMKTFWWFWWYFGRNMVKFLKQIFHFMFIIVPLTQFAWEEMILAHPLATSLDESGSHEWGSTQPQRHFNANLTVRKDRFLMFDKEKIPFSNKFNQFSKQLPISISVVPSRHMFVIMACSTIMLLVGPFMGLTQFSVYPIFFFFFCPKCFEHHNRDSSESDRWILFSFPHLGVWRLDLTFERCCNRLV